MTTCNLKDQENDLIASEFCENVSVHWLRHVSPVRTFTFDVKFQNNGCCSGRELELDIGYDSVAMAPSRLVYKPPASVFGMRGNMRHCTAETKVRRRSNHHEAGLTWSFVLTPICL